VARLAVPSDMRQYTDGAATIEVAAENYRDMVSELRRRFPALTGEIIRKQALAIDGMIVTEPLLETFAPDSELVFFAKIAGG